jgi:hypothetical protein
MSFLKDYVTVFAVIIAIINGVLAVISKHYTFERPGRFITETVGD